MYIFDSVFVKVVCMMCYVYVSCQRARSIEEEIDEETLPEDHYSFVALIDIVFTNEAKKTCTGTIIHDNVVITAAHCFNFNEDEDIQPELTASFVVIGTKKMFDTGYEQYLPIERIIIHPQYKGWIANLALVRTFAGMMSDKPGQVVPLATETTSTPVDSDVLVFSWGKIHDVKNAFTPVKKITISENSFEESCEEGEHKEETHNMNNSKRRKKIKRKRLRLENKKNVDHNTMSVTRTRGHTIWVPIRKKFENPVSSFEENSRFNFKQQRYENLTDFNSEMEQRSWENKLEKLNQLYKNSEVNRDRMRQRDRRQTGKSMSYYKNGWRRKLGDQQNKLTVEIFGYINMHSCQKMLRKAVPRLYRGAKKRQDVLCYTSERRYITEYDAGAPAMRRGRLVAVTVGSVDFEGEHVAVGLKMVCFCNWIAENLPKGGSRPQCCKNCCDANSEEEDTNKPYRHSHRKRKF
ncbi:uncharacterized protein LOC123868686 [Maniola jurtina]|uniref:uncharacterized protein LOC123868686 n=1 Tax=Maniola jurtina TaxID=191418 RepID=UPI001E6871B6|nr:uncharacterized protein LOC123868686 [Maniola jurtina]